MNSGLYLNENITVNKENINVISNIKMIGLHIDSKLSFNLHIDIICKSTSNQLNAPVLLKRSLVNEEKFVLVNSFIYSNFNDCSFVWIFSSRKSLNKIENLQKREPFALFLTTIIIFFRRLFCTEVYKTLNSFPVNIRLGEDVLKTYWRRLQDVFSVTFFCLPRRLEDIIARHLANTS